MPDDDDDDDAKAHLLLFSASRPAFFGTERNRSRNRGVHWAVPPAGKSADLPSLRICEIANSSFGFLSLSQLRVYNSRSRSGPPVFVLYRGACLRHQHNDVKHSKVENWKVVVWFSDIVVLGSFGPKAISVSHCWKGRRIMRFLSSRRPVSTSDEVILEMAFFYFTPINCCSFNDFKSTSKKILMLRI